jgi:hypothetical protein
MKALVVMWLVVLAAPAWAQKPKKPQPVTGELVAKGRHFEIRLEDTTVSRDRIGDAVIESWVHKGRVYTTSSKTATGRALWSERFETSGADLRDGANWLVEDVNGDGWDDYRYVKTRLPHCKYWWTFLWNPEKEQFDFASKLSFDTTPENRPLGRKCL